VRTYGYEPEAMIGKTLLDYVPPEDREEMRRRFEDILQGRAPRQAEARVVTKSGEARWVQHTSKYIERDGRKVGMRGVIVDIHDRKLAEEALRESEERYRRLVEELDAIIYEHDEVGRITYVSPAIEEILGYSPADIEGRKVYEFVAPERMDDARRVMEDLTAGAGEGIGEFEVRTKSGKLRWIRHVTRPLVVAGRVMGARGIVYDITELRRTGQALAESEALYESMVAHLMDGVLIIQDEKIRFANPTVERVSGYRAEELLGMNFLDLVAPDLRPMAGNRYRRRLAGEDEPTFYKLRIQRKDGQQVEIDIAATLIPFRGRPAVLAVTRELTRNTEQPDGAP
jgi:PAS domain S-box-containing protein